MAAPQLFHQDDLNKAHDELQAMLATRMRHYWLTFSQHKDHRANLTLTAQIAYITRTGEHRTFSIEGQNMVDLYKQVAQRL